MRRSDIVFNYLSGLQPYEPVWKKMRDFTHARTHESPVADQIWFLEHAPVYTQGQAGKSEHVLSPSSSIPIVQSDRGGQITYHGPGQLMVYLLLNLKHYDFHAKSYVAYLEQAMIALLKQYNIKGFTQPHAPGVYVYSPSDLSDAPALKKIASIGIRIRKNFSYHGICLNIASDLTPFYSINPCGYKGLGMAQLSDFEQGQQLTTEKITQDLMHYFKTTLEGR
jgi:lipoyl(octanoyl) transferase